MKPKRIFLASTFLVLMAVAVCFSMPQWLEDVTREAGDMVVPVEATAIVLHRVAEIEISSEGKAETKIEYAAKVLTSDGLAFGRLSQPAYPFLKVKDLKGWVIKPDGDAKKLEKSDILTFGGQESAGYYDDSQVLIARPANVVPGDIVAFELELEEKGWTSFHQSFTFQIQQPVKLARLSIKIPREWEVIHGTWRAEGIEFEQDGERYTWSASDLEYQPDEPLAPSWYYLARRISVACFGPERKGTTSFADWPSVAAWCSGVYREPASPTEEVARKSLELVEGMTTFEEKITAVARFIQEEIRYVAVEIGKNRWQPRQAATTLFNRYGDCKDKSVLMVGMLKAAGIESVPVLCNPLYPVDPRVPTPFQFNHCILAVSVENEDVSPAFENAVVGDWLLFDPTDESTRIGQLPWRLQGDRALLGMESDSVLVQLPYPNPEDFRRVYRGVAELNEDGTFSAQVTVTDFGGLAASSGYLRRITSEKDQITDWVGAMSKAVPSVAIADYRTGEAGDSTWVSFSMNGGHYVQETGGLSLLRPDIFHAPSPPVLTAGEREFPVWFGSPQEIVSRVDWSLPVGWVAEADTGETEHQCGVASISSRTTLNENNLRIKTVYRRDGHLVWPEDYDSARRFDKDVSQVRGQIAMIHKPQGGNKDE